MAADRFNGLMINRLLVLIQLFLIPIYFIFFEIRWRESISEYFESFSIPFILENGLPNWLVWFEINLAIPIFFSLPWVVFSILRATRIADTYELMGRALGKVRIDQKLFYGLNAAFTLIFLIFPFLSPVITIFGIFWAVRAVLHKLKVGKISWLIWFIPAFILSIIPILIAWAFYSNYVILFNRVLETWLGAIPTLFGIGLTLAIAISIGNFLQFLFEGSKKYGGYQDIPYGFLLIFKFLLFGLLLLIYLPYPQFVNYVNYLAVAVGFLEIILRRVRDLPAEGDWKSGIVMVIAFSVVNIVINFLRNYGGGLTEVIQTAVILISGMIFFILFGISYYYAEDEELFTK